MMGGCFSLARCRSCQEPDPKLPEEVEEVQSGTPGDVSVALWASPPAPPPMEVPLLLLTPPAEDAPAEPPLGMEALQCQLEALRELQAQYGQEQLKVRQTCQQFPRSLRALSLQICHVRRRLIRVEVRLQRQGGAGVRPPLALPEGTPEGASEGSLAAAATAPPPGPIAALSTAKGGEAIAPTLSSASFLLHPFPPPPPSPPPLQPNFADLHDVLGTLRELQGHHLHDRLRDLRNCRDCLRATQAVRGELRKVRSRLWRAEAQLGIRVPPRELDEEEPPPKDPDLA